MHSMVHVCHDFITQTLPYYIGKPRPAWVGACSSSHSKFRSHVGVAPSSRCSSSANSLIGSLTKNFDTPRPQPLAAAQILSSVAGWLAYIPGRNNCLKLYSNNSFCISQVKALATWGEFWPDGDWAFPFPVPMTMNVLPAFVYLGHKRNPH